MCTSCVWRGGCFLPKTGLQHRYRLRHPEARFLPKIEDACFVSMKKLHGKETRNILEKLSENRSRTYLWECAFRYIIFAFVIKSWSLINAYSNIDHVRFPVMKRCTQSEWKTTGWELLQNGQMKPPRCLQCICCTLVSCVNTRKAANRL